jgi:hypothetical protein
MVEGLGIIGLIAIAALAQLLERKKPKNYEKK